MSIRKKVAKYIYGACLLGFFPCLGHAQTLQQAILEAYRNNPSLKSSAADLKSAEEKIDQAYGGFLPNISAKGSYTASKGGAVANMSPNLQEQSGYGIVASQNLFSSGGSVAAINASKATYNAAKYKYIGDEQTLVVGVVNAYLDVLENMSILQLRRTNVARLEEHLRAVQNQFRVGDVTRTDVAQSLASLSKARADLIASNGDVQNSYATFVSLVGEAPHMLVETHFSFPFISLNDSLHRALKNSPDILGASYKYDASKSALTMNTTTLLPTIDLQASLMRNYNQSILVHKKWQTVGTVTLNLNVPIFQSGIKWSQRRAGEQDVVSSLELLNQVKREVINKVTKSWNQYQAILAQVSSYEDDVRSSRLAYESVLQERKVGSRTVLDVLDAQNTLLGAQVDLVRSKMSLVRRQFDILRNCGGLDRQFIMNLMNYAVSSDVNTGTPGADKVINEIEGKPPYNASQKKHVKKSSKKQSKRKVAPLKGSNHLIRRDVSAMAPVRDVNGNYVILHNKDIERANEHILNHMHSSDNIIVHP